jgi:hypothetical protein
MVVLERREIPLNLTFLDAGIEVTTAAQDEMSLNLY